MNLARIHIIEKPSLMIAPDTGVSEAIALMSQQRVSCALVVDNHQLVGIVTERDVVRITAEAMELNTVQVAAIMTRDPVQIVISPDLDIFSVLSTLRQHHIRHLPAIDESGNILGVITPNSICQVLQPTDLLKFKQVSQVMSDRVIHLPQTASLWEITQKMTENQVSCLVLVDATDDSELEPLGMITERDIVKFRALNLNLAEIVASEFMSTPLLPIKTGDSLWDAHQLMAKNEIRRLVVVNESGNLAGILTQSSLLEALEPIEMSRTIEALQEQVNRRMIELNQVNERLQEEIALREQELQERSRLEEELKAARAETESATNRVTNILESIKNAFFFLDSNWRFTYINSQAEALFQRNKEDLLGQSLWVEFPEAMEGRFYEEYHRVVAENISGEFWEFYPPLNRWFEIHAYPDQEGLFVYFEEVTEPIQSEESLKESEQFLRSIYEGVETAIFIVDVLADGTFRYFDSNPTHERIWQISAEEMSGTTPEQLLPPAVAEEVVQRYQHCIKTRERITYEEKLPLEGEDSWWLTHLSPIFDSRDRIYRLIGTSFNITDRKQAEIALEQQLKREQLLNAIQERIRSSLNLEEVLTTAAHEVRQFLSTDRVLIYRVDPDGTGIMVTHSSDPLVREINGNTFPQERFSQEERNRYTQGKIVAIEDTDLVQNLPCLAVLRKTLKIKAKLIIPILKEQNLWGLLIAHHCQNSRQWHPSEIESLRSIAGQLAIAVQQSTLFEQAKAELMERQKAEEALQASQRFVQNIAETSPNFLYIYDILEHRNI